MNASSHQNQRPDLDIIADVIPPRSRVLDLGCGEGDLMSKLIAERKAESRGVEIDENKVRICIGRGLSVRHGNIEEGLKDYCDKAFDFVVLSQTIAYLNEPEPVVREMLRVGRFAVVSFQNAGYWRRRLAMMRGLGFGVPLISNEPRERAITLAQFEDFCERLSQPTAGDPVVIAQRVAFRAGRRVSCWPEWRGMGAVYVLSR